MRFQEFSDKQWKIMQKHITKPAKTGRARSDDRMTIIDILREDRIIVIHSDVNTPAENHTTIILCDRCYIHKQTG
jgi:hypothetical protein